MKAKALGRFVADFLEGMSGGKDSETEAVAPAAAPTVIPVDTVREAVTPMIRQIVIEMLQQAMNGEEADLPPSGQQLDMMFNEARGGAADPIAEMTLRRVHEAEELTRRREREAAQGGAVPETYDPNSPEGKPWMSARIDPETIERNTA